MRAFCFSPTCILLLIHGIDESMPGKNGAVQFVVGWPTQQKPVEHGVCVECGSDSYRQTFVPKQGWFWRCYSCDPVQPRIDRHTDAKKRPMSYVPSTYQRIAHAEQVNADLKAGNKVARLGSGKVVEGFKMRVH